MENFRNFKKNIIVGVIKIQIGSLAEVETVKTMLTDWN